MNGFASLWIYPISLTLNIAEQGTFMVSPGLIFLVKNEVLIWDKMFFPLTEIEKS